MLIPKRATRDVTQQEVEAIITGGRIDLSALDEIVPRGVTNTWSANPGDRIQHGFKYDWQNTSDGRRWHVHGHAPDPAAPGGGNAANGWVVRIRCGNRWLLQAINNPPVGAPSHWTRNEALANQTHIPSTTEASRRGRRHSF